MVLESTEDDEDIKEESEESDEEVTEEKTVALPPKDPHTHLPNKYGVLDEDQDYLFGHKIDKDPMIDADEEEAFRKAVEQTYKRSNKNDMNPRR